jgi:hypothetical protein
VQVVVVSQWLPALQPQAMVAPVQVLVSATQVLAGHTAVLRQQVPAVLPETTGPGTEATQSSLPPQVQVRLVPSPLGKAWLVPLEQGCPSPPSAPRLPQVS